MADRLRSYGTWRRRLVPSEAVFVDRQIREPLELTSRVSTDDVADAVFELLLSKFEIMNAARADNRSA